MKKNLLYPAIMLLAVVSGLYSCKKGASSLTGKTAAVSSSGIKASLSTGNIALSSVDTLVGGQKDSLYLVNCFAAHSSHVDSIAAAALPSAITAYLTANYSGYSFQKAFEVLDSAKAVKAYIVIIKYNSNYVGLKFDATGKFTGVLEQMLGHQIGNPGGDHDGGPFGDRHHGPGADTIALSALPAPVLSYFKTNYPKDTLLHAATTHDSTYVVISKDTVLYATDISAAGKFIARINLQQGRFSVQAVAQTALPAAVTAYLSATYPGYVFNKAYAAYGGNTLQGYGVLITANSSNYFVLFSAAGNFVGAKTVH